MYGSSTYPAANPAPSNANHSPDSWYMQYYSKLQQEEVQELSKWFNMVDKDKSGVITPQELQSLQFGGRPIAPTTAVKLVKVFDRDGSGTIDFYEYASLHKFIASLQSAFTTADSLNKGVLDYPSIQVALAVSGFTLSVQTVQMFFRKYSQYDASCNGIAFTTFLDLVADIAMLKTRFELQDTDKDGLAWLSYDQVLAITAEL